MDAIVNGTFSQTEVFMTVFTNILKVKESYEFLRNNDGYFGYWDA